MHTSLSFHAIPVYNAQLQQICLQQISELYTYWLGSLTSECTRSYMNCCIETLIV